MGREEQIEEREVLDSIFPDEITDISETSYRVSIALDVLIQDPEAFVPPTLHLTITYPPNYPSVPPLLTLPTPPNIPHPHPHLSLPQDTLHLLSALAPATAESLGQAMIFTLISTLKESAEVLITARLEAERAEGEKEKRRAEEEEDRKFAGEAVTREGFLKWRGGFLREMAEVEEEGRRGEEEKRGGREMEAVRRREGKLTGRMLWERGLVGRGLEEEEEEEGDGGVGGVGVSGLRVGE